MYLAFPVQSMREDPDPCFMTPNGMVCSRPGAGGSCYSTPSGMVCPTPETGGSCSGPMCGMPRDGSRY
jgi:hypothetical protein